MGSLAEEQSSIVRLMERMDARYKKKCLREESIASSSLKSNVKTLNPLQKKQQQMDMAKATKAAMNFDFSKLKNTSKPKKFDGYKTFAAFTKTERKAEIKQWVKMHERGVDWTTISEKRKIYRETVGLNLRKLGLKTIHRRKFIDKKIVEKIYKQHQAVVPLKDCCKPYSEFSFAQLKSCYYRLKNKKKKGAK